jgi:hypothetical protein
MDIRILTGTKARQLRFTALRVLDGGNISIGAIHR